MSLLVIGLVPIIFGGFANFLILNLINKKSVAYSSFFPSQKKLEASRSALTSKQVNINTCYSFFLVFGAIIA